MKAVYQDPDAPECGAACIAMLADVSLKEARLAVYGEGKPKRLGRKKVLAVLKAEFNILATTLKCRRISKRVKLTDLKSNALLHGATLYKDGKKWKKSLHWLVWDFECQCVRDPLGFVKPIQVTSATELS